MKYLPLVWSGLSRRPLHPILTLISMACASALAGFAVAAGRLLPRREGDGLELIISAVSVLGFLMILALALNARMQAARERGWEFALLRALGFSGPRILALLFCETGGPCLAGAAVGLLVAQILFLLAVDLLFAPLHPALFLPGAVVIMDVAAALLVALVATLLPGRRLYRLNIASTLARGPHG